MDKEQMVVERAYFLISIAKDIYQTKDDYERIVHEFKDIPEVKSIESVSGLCDFLVQVEAPARVTSVADKVLAKQWVRRLSILRIKPFYLSWNSTAVAQELPKGRIGLAKDNTNLMKQIVD